MSLDGRFLLLRRDVDIIVSLRDDDMAYLMGMNTKELHKLCGRLREDRFLAV
jgi:transcription initiation factor TFIIE subunit alpha